MDNLSHSVVGLAAGELIHRSLPPETDNAAHATRRRMLLTAGALACNLPDLDLVLSPLLPAPLGYLLHHRGHTHTLLYAIPQALALIALIWALWPAARDLLRASGAARHGLAGTAAAGLLLHIGMDSLNSYGVHPFHPFDSGWRYGDLVFILEPVFWLAFGAPLAAMVRWTPLRYLLLAGLAGLPLYFAARGYLAWESAAALLAIAALGAWLQGRAGAQGRQALAAGIALTAAFLGAQAWASAEARAAVAAELQRRAPASRLLDAAMTAMPSNPMCWMFASIERNDAAGSYRLRRGALKLAGAANCPRAFPATGAAGVNILWEHESSLAELRALRRDSCQFDAWLRFARAPVVAGGILNDARYGNETEASFASMRLAPFAGQPCPAKAPQWDYPRKDLLAP